MAAWGGVGSRLTGHLGGRCTCAAAGAIRKEKRSFLDHYMHFPVSCINERDATLPALPLVKVVQFEPGTLASA